MSGVRGHKGQVLIDEAQSLDLTPTHALSLWQPWTEAIFYGPKRVENRSWAPPKSFWGKSLALHTAKKHDPWADKFIRALWPDFDTAKRFPAGHIVGVVTLTHATYHAQGQPVTDPWACGPWVWHLADPVVLPQPIPIRGAQGLWILGDAVNNALWPLANNDKRFLSHQTQEPRP